MGVRVAEYLGVRTDAGHGITPIAISKDKSAPQKPDLKCPFRNDMCDKAARGDKPVCSVRDEKTGQLWIVCSHRLCATSPKDKPVNDYQARILHQVAREIYGPDTAFDDVLIKREVPIKVTDESDYKADFVMWRKTPDTGHPFNPDRAVVLEMQGGGETTNTGPLTEHITMWEKRGIVDNDALAGLVSKTTPLITNAWRRQQEQFLVKGNMAVMTGGRLVFCVGSMIYDYLVQRFREGILQDLKGSNWTLALLAFEEDPSATPSQSAPQALGLRICPEKRLFTNYASFVQALTNQGHPCPGVFKGEYQDLEGKITKI